MPEVQEEFGGLTIAVDFGGTLPASAEYEILTVEDGHALLSVEGGADLAGILRRLVGSGLTISRFEPRRKSLDDIFVEVYGTNDKDD